MCLLGIQVDWNVWYISVGFELATSVSLLKFLAVLKCVRTALCVYGVNHPCVSLLMQSYVQERALNWHF